MNNTTIAYCLAAIAFLLLGLLFLQAEIVQEPTVEVESEYIVGVYRDGEGIGIIFIYEGVPVWVPDTYLTEEDMAVASGHADRGTASSLHIVSRCEIESDYL